MLHMTTPKECVCSCRHMFVPPIFCNGNTFQCNGIHVQPITRHNVLCVSISNDYVVSYNSE